MIDFINY